MAEKKRGGPSGKSFPLYSDEVMISALKSKKGLVYLAAKKIGCTPQTIYNRAKISPAVEECINTQRGEIIDTAEERLFQAVNAREPWAVALVLKTIGHKRGYIDRSKVYHKNAPPEIDTGGVRIRIDSLDLPLETRRQILDAVKKAKERQNASISNDTPVANGHHGNGKAV